MLMLMIRNNFQKRLTKHVSEQHPGLLKWLHWVCAFSLQSFGIQQWSLLFLQFLKRKIKKTVFSNHYQPLSEKDEKHYEQTNNVTYQHKPLQFHNHIPLQGLWYRFRNDATKAENKRFINTLNHEILTLLKT